MSTRVAHLFKQHPEGIRALDLLMRNCQNGRCRKVHVVAVGCGDAFITKYWPTLWEYINQDLIILTVADEGPLEALIEKKVTIAKGVPDEGKAAQKLEDGYRNLLRMIQQPSREYVKAVKYVDLLNPQDREWYEHMPADVVFILVPDDAHIREARPWNGRATIVFIEKPYNRSVTEAQKFIEALERLAFEWGDAAYTFFFGLDHYLAKVFNYIKRREDLLFENRLGQIREIEFSICESGGVEPWRASTLEAGIVYDLLPHVLAMFSPLVDLASFEDRYINVRVARHKDCPIGAESYAHLDMPLSNALGRKMRIVGDLAKGAGSQDEKFARLKGEHAVLHFELNPDREGHISLLEDGVHVYPLFGVNKGHPEILKTIFSGNFMEQPIGAITGKEAIGILQIITAIRSRVEHLKGRLAEYAVGTAARDIYETATHA